jgi:hypothetical protein
LESKFDHLARQLDAMGDESGKNALQEVKWMGDELKKLSREILKMQDEMEFKIDEDRLREALSTLGGAGGSGSSAAAADLSKLSDKFSTQIKNLEKRINKLQHMFDLNKLMGKIDLKADEEAVRTEFSNHDFKISDVDRNCE